MDQGVLNPLSTIEAIAFSNELSDTEKVQQIQDVLTDKNPQRNAAGEQMTAILVSYPKDATSPCWRFWQPSIASPTFWMPLNHGVQSIPVSNRQTERSLPALSAMAASLGRRRLPAFHQALPPLSWKVPSMGTSCWTISTVPMTESSNLWMD